VKRWLSRIILFLLAFSVVVFAINAATEVEQNLTISEQTIDQLRILRNQDKFTDLPGYDTEEEKIDYKIT
jgi:hypothetical protein